jgi:hypothetical protein
MSYIKITEPGWAGFTGELGMVTFENGVSTEPVSKRIADRLGGLMKCVLVDDKGVEEGVAGAPTSIQNSGTIKPPEHSGLIPVTERELEEERSRLAIEAGKPKVTRLYSEEQLLSVADSKGIKGLREIGNPWNVKGRAIPELIEAILDAQASFIQAEREKGRKILLEGFEGDPDVVEEKPVVEEIRIFQEKPDPAAEHLKMLAAKKAAEEKKPEPEPELEPELGLGFEFIDEDDPESAKVE